MHAYANADFVTYANHSKAKLMNVLKRSVTVMPVEITLHHLRASRPVARRLPRYSLVLPA